MSRFAATAETALPVEELQKLISYDPATGRLTWKVARNSHGGKTVPGTDAGAPDKNGYVLIGINGLRYYAHRLAWYMHHGIWPTGQIDHVDMDYLNNRIENLREATMTQQRANQRVRVDSKSGLKGVQQTNRGKWRARIRSGGIARHLGEFDTPEQAHAAYVVAAQRMFGEFARSE